MGFIRTTFTFMVGTLWGVYMCQNYNIPDIRRFADSDLVRTKQIEEAYPKPKPKSEDEDKDV